RLIADVVRVFDIREQFFARGALHVVNTSGDRKFHRNQIAVNLVIETLPCRCGRPLRIRRADSAEGSTREEGKRPAGHEYGKAGKRQEASTIHNVVLRCVAWAITRVLT